MKKLFFILLFIIPLPVAAQTYLPKVEQLYEWKKESFSPEFVGYKPIYEAINLSARKWVDKLDFYKPHFLEVLFLIEKNLLEFDLTQANWVGINLTLPKNFFTNKPSSIEKTATKKNVEIVLNSTKDFLKNKKKDLVQAKKILLQLYNNKKPEIVSLWLAWIFYLEGDFTQAQQFLDRVYHSSNLEIALPAEYIQTMLYLKNKDYRKIPLQIKNWQLYYPQIPIPYNLQLASVLALMKSFDFPEVQKNLAMILLEMQTLKKNKDFRISQTFALLQALHYYQQKKYSSSYKILRQLKTQNLNEEKKFQLNYWKAWSALLAKNTLSKKTKATLLKKNHLQKNKKEELDYLFFLDSLLRSKNPKISLLKKIKTSSFYPHGIIMLSSHKNISKNQKKILYQEYIELDTPELIFYYNTQKADYLRKNFKFNQALQHYLKARNASLLLSENSQKLLSHTNLNIGLLYLREKKYKQAERVFLNYQTSLQVDSLEKNYSTQKWYYLATIYYFQKKPAEILALPSIKKDKKSKFYSKYYREQFFFKAWAHDSLGNDDATLKQIKLAQIHQSSAIQSLTNSLLFKKKKYREIIRAHNPKKNHNFTSDKFYIASLLKLDREKKALEYLQKISKKPSLTRALYTDLYLEVWLANQLYNRAIDFALQKLHQKNSSEINLYKNLSFAYHQLENWDLSIQYLEKIIALNPNSKSGKNAADNIFLNLIYSTEKKHLRHKENITSNQEKNTLDLWKKTVLLAEQHTRKLEFHQALKIYQNYLKKNTFQKASIQLLNQEILYLQSYWDLCIEYGKNPFFQETLSEKTDREIATNYCSLRQNKKIQFPIPPKPDYRKNSWLFLQALMEKQTTEKQTTEKQTSKNTSQILTDKISIKELNSLEQQKYRLLQAKNQLENREFTSALNSLKQTQNYIYFPANYMQKLFLETQIYLHLEKKKEALNRLVKLIYLPLEKTTRRAFIFTAMELLIEQGWREETRLFFKSINPKGLTLENREKYNKIKQQLIENQ